MATLYNFYRIIIKDNEDEDPAVFTLRRPTNEELNLYEIVRYSIKQEEKVKITAERVKFFDLLLSNIEGFNHADGTPVTLDQKELIYDSWKDIAILRKFELYTIDIKNS